MKKLLLLSCCLLLSAFCFSQLNTFRLTYDVGAFDITGGMVETPAKEYVIAGLNNSFGPYYGNAMKIDSAGAVIWAKTYTGGFATNFADIKNVSTGGYIITGSSTSGGGGALLVRLDNSGNVLWAKRYQLPNNPSGNASSEWGTAVIETSDGGFLVGGGVDYFWDGAAVTTVDTTSALAFKTDAAGTLVWSKVWTLTNPAMPDEHFFNDVAESSDGYFFVGESADETQAYDADGDLPRNALLIKTNKAAGTTTYIRRWGAGGTTSQGINCSLTLTTGANAGRILLGGYDDIHAFLITVDGTGGVPTMGAFNRRINGAAFPPRSLIIQDIMENADGNYSVIGMQIEPLSFAFYTALFKINSSTGAIIFGRGYAPIGLSSILPEGGLCANQGYYVSMTDQQAGGFNYNILRTNTVGQLGAGPAGCTSVNLAPSTSGYAPGLSTPASLEYSTLTESAFVPVVNNIVPVRVQDCYNVACAKPPAAASAAPSTICAGQSTTLTASGGTSYSWNTGATTSVIVVSPTSTTAYTATVTLSGCDSIPAPVTVTVNSLPAASISGNNTICQGQSTTLTASGGGTYAWNTGATTAPITVSPTTGTSYTVTVTGANGCTNIATSSVTVSTAPTASVSAASTTVCSGSSTTLTASGGSSYSWSTGATTNPIVVSPTSATTYTVTVSNGSCSSTTTITVSTNSLPTAAIGGSANICSGDAATLTASGGTGYSWNTGATTAVINPSPTTSTTYTVVVSNANGCTDTATFTVNVLAPPVASVSGNTTICSGQSATLSASGGGNYSWNTGATTSSITVSPTSGTTYTVVVSAGSCSDVATASVTVNPSPNASINTASTSLCAGQNATLTATGGGTYSWSTGTTSNPIIVSPTAAASYTVVVSNGSCSSTATVSLTVNSPVTAGVTSSGASTICSGTNATLTASGGGTYSWTTGSTSNPIVVSPSTGTTYSVIVSNGTCSDTAALTISVNPSPTASVSATGSSICAGQSATLTATGGGTYAWNTGATTAVISVTLSASTNYTVTVTAANGCTAVATASIAVTPIPNATISANTTICSGDAVTLNAGGGTTYLWNPGGQTASSIVVNPGASTTYTVTAANGPCTDTATSTISVNPSPTAGAGPDISINYGSSTTLSGSGGGSYSWSTGETGSSISVSPTVTTTYTLVVTDANGCTDADVVTVYIDYNCGNVFVPNAFSPNGDLKNDVLRVRSPCLKAMHFVIYDRWGVKAFETEDITMGWDGMYKNDTGNTAVFFYTLTYELVTGDTGELKGTVTLVR